jgi:hypothetical protein
VAAVPAALVAVLTGCAADDPGAPAGLGGLPAGAHVDYQLGGAYPPADGVAAVVRDRTEKPADRLWSACYVNAFQTQPGSADWPEELLLHDAAGARVEDPDWPGEFLVDVSTGQRRQQVLGVVGPWIDGCATAGFDAVEPDNLDSWLRSAGLLTRDDNAAMARLLVDRAHTRGLVIAQKNAPELVAVDPGFDYAVTEDCGRYDECTVFTDAYPRVLDVEYSDQGFAVACTLPGLSVQRRDLGVGTPDDEGYVAEWCPDD